MSDRFIIEKQISSRNSADAFLAIDTTTELRIRLRRIHSNMSPEQLMSVKDAFRVTQRQLALVKSDLILQITESGIDEEGAWLSLPYYENKQLLSIHTLPITLPDFHNLAAQLFTALDAIHKENLVHGALTANSIDVVPPETPNALLGYRIRDLGMRRLLLLVQNPSAISNLPSDNAILAPELFQNQDAEPTTDIYMAGQILYYLLAGGHPFVGLSEDEALSKHLAHDIPLAHTSNPDIPEEVSLWLDKLTQPDPSDRLQTAQEALEALPHVPADTRRQPTSLVFNKGKLTAAQTIHAKKEDKKLPPYIYVIVGLVLATVVGLFFVFRAENEDPVTSNPDALSNPQSSVEIKVVSVGSVSGQLDIYKKHFKIGHDRVSKKVWGKGNSKDAVGPDLGSTHRAYLFFKVADIIDASDKDKLVNVASLDNLTLELTIVGKKQSKEQPSLLPVAYPGIIMSNSESSRVKGVIKKLENGIVGSSVKGSQKKRYLFKFDDADFSDADYSSYIVFPLTVNAAPEIGKTLRLEKTTALLKITK